MSYTHKTHKTHNYMHTYLLTYSQLFKCIVCVDSIKYYSAKQLAKYDSALTYVHMYLCHIEKENYRKILIKI